ncbi:hypothetical protein ABKV19_005011 [Rosa sericea]
MGIWDIVSGASDSLKRNAPNQTPVTKVAKNVFSTAYGFGSAAVTKVDGAVRDKMIPYFRNEQVWSKISLYGPILLRNGASA